MKATSVLKRIALITALGLGTALIVPVLAQQGPGMGGGPGMQGAGQGADTMGPGMRHGGRGGHGMRNNMQGAGLMTQEERAAHQLKMREVKTYDDCKLLHAEQRKIMEERAGEKGITLPTPRQNRCDMMKTRGFIK